ncbi:Serine/threonine-protein kinase PknA [Thalassoglobus neptunius]|uniref:Serine/threonine-protein kinase PknA n=1 Tax=Thalassoglobus neptunius TaxID=1938619 RepID=A0A5C5X490_9PLAN|nr:protein kinase [Thalassoglobus neptunius]TWT57806.1 Serine/threonine-protein kinase PknA [Thalassoglobus neptunius]
MFEEADETISLAMMQELLLELQDYCESGRDFSILEMVESRTVLSNPRELLTDLVRHHYSMLKERQPDLSVEDYGSLFPDHAPWSGKLAGLSGSSMESSWDKERTEAASVPLSGSEEGITEFACGPLENLPPQMQSALYERMHRIKFKAGDFVIREGTHGDCLLVCVEGAATVSISSDETTPIELGSIFPGHVFGEMSLMGTPLRTASVVADSDMTVLSLSSSDFHDLCQRHPEFSNVMTMIVADRLGRRSHDALSTVTLEGYKINRRLGRGGMAVVYDAIQLETNRRVALKMMSHRLAIDSNARNWFTREAEIIANFHHPGIPILYERFDAFATSFIAMEFLEGCSLSDVSRIVGPLDEESVLRILAQLADALSYAHQEQIVHRDIKPSNCMLAPSGSVKLMDFGLSLPIFRGDDDRPIAAGTPAYISPEQMRGQNCPAADWFSLGLVGFELTTGKKAFRPKNMLQLSRQYFDWKPDQLLDSLASQSSDLCKVLKMMLSLDVDARGRAVDHLSDYRKPVDVGQWSCFQDEINPRENS